MTARLIHVGVQESLARRFMSGEDAPAWLGDGQDEGKFTFRRWGENQMMASLTATMTGDQHGVRVTISALYQFGEGEVPPSEEDVQAFLTDHVGELLPFLRQAVYTASSQVWPIKPIMMDAISATDDYARA